MQRDKFTEETLPQRPIEKVKRPLEKFMHVEAASGIILLVCTAVALILANSSYADAYLSVWETPVGFNLGTFEMIHPLQVWINDGLMAIFFFLIGLEVKREVVLGELNEIRKASLPIVAALGGMIVPASIYLSIQIGEPGQNGWGIPMATDIAFVVGCMAVLGSRVPRGLRVMLLSLAIADDIGAILVIAIGYTEELHLASLAFGFLGIGVVFLAERLGVRSFGVYTFLGIVVWLLFHESGIHATIAGVILGLMTPASSYLDKTLIGRTLDRAQEVLHGEWDSLDHRGIRMRRFQRVAREVISPLEYLEDRLHPWVSYLIMPVFALANAGVAFEFADFFDSVALAVMAGLVVGKPVGVFLFSWLAIRLGLVRLPVGVNWGALFGGGILAGIGFTMALFIAGLALQSDVLDAAKVGVLAGSAVSAAVGMLILVFSLPDQPQS